MCICYVSIEGMLSLPTGITQEVFNLWLLFMKQSDTCLLFSGTKSICQYLFYYYNISKSYFLLQVT